MFPTTANALRTDCSACVATYYQDDEGQCQTCPEHVDCPAGSQVHSVYLLLDTGVQVRRRQMCFLVALQKNLVPVVIRQPTVSTSILALSVQHVPTVFSFPGRAIVAPSVATGEITDPLLRWACHFSSWLRQLEGSCSHSYGKSDGVIATRVWSS